MLIYLDFAKAFDKVPHQCLLTKAKAYGINGKTLMIIRSFLNERKQQVSVNCVRSNSSDVTSGLPQGSVLGPILFLLYINDMSDSIRSAVLFFADDTKLFSRLNNSMQHPLQNDLDELADWAHISRS